MGAVQSLQKKTREEKEGEMTRVPNPKTGITRRSFLKTTGAVAAAAAIGASFTGCAGLRNDLVSGSIEEERHVVAQCRANCNGGCLHDITVRDGMMVNITKGHYPNEDYTGICLRGQSNLYRTYKDDRVKYPMRRVAGSERGSGEYERISWDEAISEIASKLNGIIDEYGPKAIVKDTQSGCLTFANGPLMQANRFAATLGCTVTGDMYDRNSCHGSYRVMGVDPYDYSNEPADLQNAAMVVVWGTNPVYTEPHVWRHIRLGQDKGSKVVVIDPVKSATAHKADLYIPLTNPGNDLYLVLAMINYAIKHDFVDHDFLIRRTNAPFLVRRDNGEMMVNPAGGSGVASSGYDINGVFVEGAATFVEEDYFVHSAEGKNVLLGDLNESERSSIALEGTYEVEGVTCDTVYTLMKKHFAGYEIADAAEAMGADAQVLEDFAREFCTIGPVTCNVSYGMDHYYNGHLFFQALCILQGILGNFGKHGAGLSGMFSTGNPLNIGGVVAPEGAQETTEIPAFLMYDVWRDQKWNGEEYPVKALVTAGSNSMSNYAEQNRWFTDVFPNMEMWVVIDHSWSDSARHADYVLPASFWYEVKDIRVAQNIPYATICRQVIEPLYESKPDSEIYSLIVNAMDSKHAKQYPPEWGMDDWIDLVLDCDSARAAGMTLEKFEEKTAVRYVGESDDNPVVKGDEWNPFPTNHGRLTLYWEDPQPRAFYGQVFTQAEIDKERFPYYREPLEVGPTNPLREKYPLVFYQFHERFRTHSQYFDAPNLNELSPDPYVRIGSGAASARGIGNGDVVEVFNDRGHVVVKALVDNNFPDTAVSVPKGWQRHQFIAGGYAELGSADVDPWGVSAAYYDILCDVRPWKE